MRHDEGRTGRRCRNLRPFARWAFSWHSHNFRARPAQWARAREPLLAPAGCRR
jgi:hypothetical protein